MRNTRYWSALTLGSVYLAAKLHSILGIQREVKKKKKKRKLNSAMEIERIKSNTCLFVTYCVQVLRIGGTDKL